MKHVQHEKLHSITLLFRELSYNKDRNKWKWCFARSAIFCKQSKRLLHDGCRYCGDAETFHASVCLFCVPSGEISFCLQVAHSYYIKVPAWRVAIIHAEASQASGIEETRAVEVGSRPSTAAWIMKERFVPRIKDREFLVPTSEQLGTKREMLWYECYQIDLFECTQGFRSCYMKLCIYI